MRNKIPDIRFAPIPGVFKAFRYAGSPLSRLAAPKHARQDGHKPNEGPRGQGSRYVNSFLFTTETVRNQNRIVFTTVVITLFTIIP